MQVRSYRMLIPTILAAALVATLSPIATASPPGRAAADEVSLDSYRDFLDLYLYTHVGDNRGFGAEHDMARDNIVTLFESYGLTVALEPFQYNSSTYYNVVATKVGTLYPNTQFILGAHFDSVDNPGADDDASGTALVLEAARILSQYESDYTIKFIAFDREEQGLYGSNAYVDAHFTDDIVAMIQADMVAYDPGTNHARLYGDGNALTLKGGMIDAVDEYGNGLTASDYGWNGQSDHAPFAYAGFEACLLIEGEVWNNPFYHTASDNFENPDNLNFEYAVTMARSVVGYLVDQAGVQVPADALIFDYPDGRPDYIDPSGGTRVRVGVTAMGDAVELAGSGLLHYDLGGGWQTAPMETVSPGLYDAVFPSTACPAQVLYYVSAETTTGTLYLDPHDAPATVYDTTAANGRIQYFADDFQVDRGWTVSGNALTGHWNRGVPVGGGDRGDPPADLDGSGMCYLTDNVDGDSDIDDGYTYLDSPVIDLSAGDAVIEYALWYSNEFGSDPNNDLFKTYVSNDDGVEWSLVETVGPVSAPGWIMHAFTVGDFVTPTAQVRVRFEASDLNAGSVVEAGIDAFSVFVYDCPVGCPPDLDGSGDVAFADLLSLLANWGPCPDCPQDLDNDNVVGFQDLLILLAAWGPCI